MRIPLSLAASALTASALTASAFVAPPAGVPQDESPVAGRARTVPLIVRVRDTRGAPVPVRSARALSSLTEEPEAAWPKTPTVFVLPPAERARGPARDELLRARGELPWEGSPMAKGELRFDVARGEELVVAVAAPGQALEHRRVAPGADDANDVLTFQLEAPKAVGALKALVLDPRGREVFADLELCLVDRETGIPIVIQRPAPPWPEGWSAADPLRFDGVPEGEYDLVVEALPQLDWHGRVFVSRSLASARVPVVVRAGETSEGTVRLGRPARIDLALAGLVNEDDVAAFERRHPPEDPLHDLLEPMGFGPDRASVRLRPEHGYPIPVEFVRYGYANSTAAGQHLFSTLPLGTRATSEVLATGEFVLEVELPGGRKAQERVLLVAEETLKIEFDLGEE